MDITVQAHGMSGEYYALDWRDDQIIGVCGPLTRAEAAEVLFQQDCDFEVEDVEWARTQPWSLPRSYDELNLADEAEQAIIDAGGSDGDEDSWDEEDFQASVRSQHPEMD